MADNPPGACGAISRNELKKATFIGLRWATPARVAAEAPSVGAGVLLADLVPPDQFGRVAITLC